MGINYAALGGQFTTIVADPPWRYQNNNTMKHTTAEAHYPTMRTEAMAEIDVASWATPSAHLYMWVTNPMMLDQRPTIRGALTPLDLVRAWGFEPKSLLTWVKTNKGGDAHRGGMGWYFRGATEHVIFAVRGDLGIAAAKRLPNVFFAPKQAHSVKPEVLYEIVEGVSPGPYLEMFARRRRSGWSSWGNEVPNPERETVAA
jgi:N6-adenosine-specific RNA methylase IME4